MKFDIDSFLHGCIGSLSVLNVAEVKKIAEASDCYEVVVKLQIPRDTSNLAELFSQKKVDELSNNEFRVNVRWSPKACILRMWFVTQADEFGPVLWEKATSLLNLRNGVSDRLSSVVMEQTEDGLLAYSVITVLLPMSYLKKPERIETMQVVVRNMIGRLVSEAMHDCVELNMALAPSASGRPS